MYAHRFGSRQGQDMPATAKETAATTSQPAGEVKSPDESRPLPGSVQQIEHADSVPPVVSVVRRNAGAWAGGALVLGVIAGELLNAYERRVKARR